MRRVERNLFELFRDQGGRWSQVPGYREKRRDGLSPWMMHDVAVDPGGRVHLGSSGGWWREQEGEWKRFGTAVPSLETLFFTEISPGHDGVMFGTCNGGLFYVTPDDAMFRVPLDPGEEGFHDVTIAPTGEVAMIGALDEIVRIRPGEPARVTKLGALKAPGTTVRDVEIDGQSRTWLASDDSLTLLGPKDEVLQQWARGTLDEITGNIRTVAVIGEGPGLPTQHEAVVGTVVGRITDYQVDEFSKVSLCLHVGEYKLSEGEQSRLGTVMCTPGTVLGQSSLSTDGTFRFENIARGTYALIGPDDRTAFVAVCAPP